MTANTKISKPEAAVIKKLVMSEDEKIDDHRCVVYLEAGASDLINACYGLMHSAVPKFPASPDIVIVVAVIHITRFETSPSGV